MPRWYSKHYKSEEIPSLDRLSNVMLLAPHAATHPGFALFSETPDGESGQTWHISPEAQVLALALSAMPSAKPIPQPGFALLLGAPAGLQYHFPDYAAGLPVGDGNGTLTPLVHRE